MLKGWTPEQRLAFTHKIIISVVGSILGIVITVSIFISCKRSLRDSKRKREEFEKLKLMNSKLNVDNDSYIICSNASIDSQVSNNKKIIKETNKKQKVPYYRNESTESKSRLLNGNLMRSELNDKNTFRQNKLDSNPDNFSLNLSDIDIDDDLNVNIAAKKYQKNVTKA